MIAPSGTPDRDPLAELEEIARPDGRLYRPRKVTAAPVFDGDEIESGVIVFGTHDIGRAQPLADQVAMSAAGSSFRAARPVTVWWRDGFEGGRRNWVDDPVKGRAGVWFRELAETCPQDVPDGIPGHANSAIAAALSGSETPS